MFRIELKEWEQARTTAGPIRYAIFMGEPDAPSGIELDDQDKDCVHAIAYSTADEKAVGTGRLMPDGQIGRMAVLKDWRRLGVGAALLDALVEEARKRGFKEVVVSVPLQAADFYRGKGFVADGKVFEEAGSLYEKMRMGLQASA